MSRLLLLFFLLPQLSSASSIPTIHVWPKPTKISWPKPKATLLSSSFHPLTPLPPPSSPLRAALRRTLRLLQSERHHPLNPPSTPLPPSSPPLLHLSLSLSQPSAPLLPGADESYSLSISSGLANLSAATPWGAIRGLETLSQLAWGCCPPSIPTEIEIYDRPIYSHRGLLLDTSRNFYPVRDLLRTIRAMSYNKMNVFHWHITDSHSFPIVLPSEPTLGLRGAYSAEYRYSADDVRRVVEYASSRGVRVVPEIDAPGHTGSWAAAYPEIVTCAGKFWAPPGKPPLAAEPGTGQLNPLHPKTYQVVHNVLHDISLLFPDHFLHAGADEVTPACWEDDGAIQKFLSDGGSVDDLIEIFINFTHPFITSLNRTAVYWEDLITGSSVKVDPRILPRESTVFQTWNNGPNSTKVITSAGFRVIVSSSDFYYLDCGHGGWVGNDSRYDRQVGDAPGRPFNYAGGNGGSWCAPFKSWQRVYDYDIAFGLNEEEKRLVLGGEVALWSEQADGTVVDGRLWPRAAAMAEALWSGNRDEDGRKRYGEATDRLNEWRFRMVGRGIRAEPIQPLWCVKNPGMCNLVQ